MNTVAIRLRDTSLDLMSLVATTVDRVRERQQIIAAMHHLHSLPDCRLEDIGVSRSQIPKITGGEKLLDLRALTRMMIEHGGSEALNKAHFHSGK